jgi:hypothetical protein
LLVKQNIEMYFDYIKKTAVIHLKGSRHECFKILYFDR